MNLSQKKVRFFNPLAFSCMSDTLNFIKVIYQYYSGYV